MRHLRSSGERAAEPDGRAIAIERKIKALEEENRELRRLLDEAGREKAMLLERFLRGGS